MKTTKIVLLTALLAVASASAYAQAPQPAEKYYTAKGKDIPRAAMSEEASLLAAPAAWLAEVLAWFTETPSAESRPPRQSALGEIKHLRPHNNVIYGNTGN